MTSDSPRGGDVFDIDHIRQIVELMEQHELSEVDLQQADDRIKLTRGGTALPPAMLTPPAPLTAASSPTPASTPPPSTTTEGTDAPGTVTINSPMVGTFYGKPNPESKPFVEVGQAITEETVVCIIEAMKVFNEIPAECSGKILEVLVKDQEPVDFGKPLFRIQVDG
ncbi:MAG: acetyl-CoA carboxylase biotin carboxyl carrier protein [Planctomycetota bacterium]